MSKWGLVLGGGGAKGAYQIGVFQALQDYHLSSRFSVVAGTSIGAINGVLFVQQDWEKTLRIWNSLSYEVALGDLKKPYLWLSQGLFSRDRFVELFHQEVNLETIRTSKCELYALTSNISDHQAEIFHMNDLPSETFLSVLMASSALPAVFGKVSISGKEYRDGGLYQNIPLQVAVEQGCDLIFVIPTGDGIVLSLDQVPSNAIVVNFNDYKLHSLNPIEGTLGFNQTAINERIERGYTQAKKLIEYLRKEGLVRVSWRDHFRYWVKKLVLKRKPLRSYYSLSDVGYTVPENVLQPKKNLIDNLKSKGKEWYK